MPLAIKRIAGGHLQFEAMVCAVSMTLGGGEPPRTWMMDDQRRRHRAAEFHPHAEEARAPADLGYGGEKASAGAEAKANMHSPDEALRLRAMLDHHFDFVFLTLRAFGVRAADAEDEAQTVFIIVARKLAVITAGSERAFLFATARGVASNARRSGTRNREDASSDTLPATVDQGPDPEEATARSEARSHLIRIMDGMDEDSRAVFMLFELEGMTMVEIAKVVDAPQGTVASRLRRAREHFGRESQELAKDGGRE